MPKLTFQEKDLVKSIANRVANNKIDVKITEESRVAYTDGQTITVGEAKDVFTTCAIAAHEGSHIRFKSKSTPEILRHINKDYPSIAQFVLNVYEDYRCNSLNAKIYSGYVKRLKENGIEMVKNEVIQEKLLNTFKQLSCILEYPTLYDEDNTYPIWDTVDKSKAMIEKYLAFEASVIVSKIIVDKIMEYHKADPEAMPIEDEKLEEVEKKMGRSKCPSLGSKTSAKKSMSIIKDYEAGTKGDMKRMEKASKRLKKAKKEILDELRKMKTVPKSPEPGYMSTGVTKQDLDLPRNGAGEEYHSVKSKNIEIINQLRREFKRIMRSTNANRGGRAGRISVRDLPRMVASNGRFDKVFKIDRRDFGANLMIVIDESGSTQGHCIAVEREVVITLMEALEGTAVNTCVIGFSAQSGRKVVGERVYKEFNATLNREKLSRINSDSADEGFYENRDGDSFEISAMHFGVTNHKNSIMIVLSDGMPSHGGTGYDGEKMTNKSVRELRASGINVHGVGIGIYDGEDYGNMYDNKDYTLIELDNLEEKCVQMIRGIAKDIHVPNV